MKAQRMLQILAGRYAVMEGPMRRQLDAQTLLKMAIHLDEEAARIYLERFVAKWRLDLQEAADTSAELSPRALEECIEQEGLRRSPASVLVRRRPMTELERRVQDELVGQARETEVVVTVEGRDGEVRAI